MNMQKILTELKDKGFSDYAIAERIGSAPTIVNRMRNGIHKSTTFERGLRIVMMHMEANGQNCECLVKYSAESE
jgi:hypothetical protein